MNGGHHSAFISGQPVSSYSSISIDPMSNSQEEKELCTKNQHDCTSGVSKTTVASERNKLSNSCSKPLLTGTKKKLYEHVMLSDSNMFVYVYICNQYFFISQNPTLFFNDGKRKIDFMLVVDELFDESISEESVTKQQIFESNLEKEGLELEYVNTEGSLVHFIKVHAPDEILRRYAEILKLRMPMKMVTSYFVVLWSVTNIVTFR